MSRTSFAAPVLPASYRELLALSPQELGKIDIAVMNLLCAKGLPGAEKLDIPAAIAKFDEWAGKVKFQTERHLYRVSDPRYAVHYGHSEARLRAEFIIQCLQEDCGANYNHARIDNPDFRDSGDCFIHGMLPGGNGGTCGSMPVLYVAIGRRLGYPMKLVAAKSHLFCRWEDGKERFNIEGAGEGVSYYEDDHYRTWPIPISDAEMKSGEFLKPMTPQEELANFLLQRAGCFQAHRRVSEERACLTEALGLMPNSITLQAALRSTERRPMRIAQQLPPGYVPTLPPQMRPMLPQEPPDPTPRISIPMPGMNPNPTFATPSPLIGRPNREVRR